MTFSRIISLNSYCKPVGNFEQSSCLRFQSYDLKQVLTLQDQAYFTYITANSLSMIVILFMLKILVILHLELSLEPVCESSRKINFITLEL